MTPVFWEASHAHTCLSISTLKVAGLRSQTQKQELRQRPQGPRKSQNSDFQTVQFEAKLIYISKDREDPKTDI